MLKHFRMDLHIHTCLSPCADLEMLPGALVKEAKNKKLDAIGICDHNSMENVAAVKKAASKEGLCVFAGIEITSAEEVHILAFFDENAAQDKMQDIVYNNLSGKNDADFFGEQLVTDENGRLISSNEKLLIGSTSLKVEEIVHTVHDLGGLAIASHIDRESFSILGHLGFIPRQLALDAVELSANYELEKLGDYESYGLPIVAFSDAHFLSDIGRICTDFLLDEPTLPEIKMAFKGAGGRGLSI
ncbi:MAG: histidinol-phosphatase [Candidatus Omnitrophica bacterium CG11_big_fil_rev_8_21_14_0_20_42_13]|uniref:Histidinol-phosphatase n=1 Tax=Candidatus Ghiorseimicrobium undicola TaxID=1974746 RepID=A0A2H0LYI6_9BACT|nr:MAG: histidinol-phosphatase [Candidatus Omnitrophica bacterium CG11_big_fil_rev_8_21_14_0_20_42_13]